ncbi:hypothetical protein BS78_05G118100 [Paspalum vaginatum]|nr:hypothetical protein BS78_05G118100 [Paspalum vaginatum]
MKEPLLAHGSSSSLEANAGFFSNITFSWMGHILDLGKKKTLDLGDVPVLDEGDSAHGILPMFTAKISSVSSTGQFINVTIVNLSKALMLVCWKLFLATAVYSLLSTVSSYVGPYLIEHFVDYLNESQRSTTKGYLLVLVFVAAQFIESFSTRHLHFKSQQLGIRLRSALITVLYQKGLVLSSKSKHRTTIGQMINIVSLDAEQVGNFNRSMHEIWLLPIQIILAMLILHSTLGLAAFATLGATILSMLANIPLGRIEQYYQDKTMRAKDTRMKALSEILQHMRILKLHGWDSMFLSKIKELRKTEMICIKKYIKISAIIISLFFGTPAFVATITFGTCMLIGVPLETGKVLSALATFRQLQGPIHSLPDTISSIIQTKISLDRINSFLCLEEIASDGVIKVASGSTNISVEVKNGFFSWDVCSQLFTLQDLNFCVQKGMRVAICGRIGSGKSSLLSCILGDIPKLSGEVKTCGVVSYVSQSPWIHSGTIEDNILFGTQMDRGRYETVLKACSLQYDINQLCFGDQTHIGENGINLSGGQKQRINIARALYHDAEIYLFDDPFSAVDAHTGLHLFKECLHGFLASKTVVFVTQHAEFLPLADALLVLRDGKIVQSGGYREILESGGELKEFVSDMDALPTVDLTELPGDNSVSTHHSGCSGSDLSITEDQEDDNYEDEGIVPYRQLVQEEKREKGRVGLFVYWKYITMAYNGSLVPLILLAHIIFQVLQIGNNFWIAWAAPISKEGNQPVSCFTMVNVYVSLAVVSTLCIFMRSHLLVMAGCKTASIMFDKMHECLFRAPMSFFDSTPSGRILNRASTDQSTVDTRIFDLMGYLLFPAIELIGTVILMSQVSWPVFVIFIPIIAASLWYQQYYIDAARELQRLTGVCKAPVIEHFAESITGSNIIRCFGKERQFTSSMGNLVDNLSRPSLYNAAAMQWLCFRLDMLSAFIFSFALILLVCMPTPLIDSRTAGLAVTYGLSLNMLQGWTIAVLCSLENRMISVERLLQYMNIPSEPPLTIPGCRPNCQWPTKGEIKFRNLHIRYASHLPFILKGLTCTIPGGRKTGIVGRTGGGKSTLIQAIFRIVDPSIGQVLIDGIDICTIGLHDLRTKLNIVPQDPVMFEGTLRNNMDPLGEYSDQQIWEALDCCHLGDEVRKKELKLDSIVIENGQNWSAGQRQLVCLGRVILKRRRILVLDEATSSVDPITDKLIQETLKQQFSEFTVITIAHRITSVLDSDNVIVLQNGMVLPNLRANHMATTTPSFFPLYAIQSDFF